MGKGTKRGDPKRPWKEGRDGSPRIKKNQEYSRRVKKPVGTRKWPGKRGGLGRGVQRSQSDGGERRTEAGRLPEPSTGKMVTDKKKTSRWGGGGGGGGGGQFL